MKTLTLLVASALMAALYARGGPAWVLGFVFLAPWMRALDGAGSLRRTLLLGYLMSLGFTAAAFAWLGGALGEYLHIGYAGGVALFLLVAPLFQPQFLAYALVRRAARRWYGGAASALAAAAAWLALEWLAPRLVDDTIGYGLYPASLLRQAADLGGGAGLTLFLLLANEAVAAAAARRAQGWRVAARPLALAALAPLVLAAYGLLRTSGAAPAPAKPLRVALVQANLAGYEARRAEKGAYAVVREILDRHFAMSYDAVVRQRADAVLWSETAYPTTFGQPKSAAGAEFDQEILANVNAAGVPFVFGTYDRDANGEYNAAAFVQPVAGLTGFYRKSRLFLFTEYLPAWLDTRSVRGLLPWAGNWRAGNGARVLPLRLADGREVPVLPLICLDDVDAGLAVQGARLGAQAIFTMSNDSWFDAGGQGARMHQLAAAFRSIETRLPQFRVTTSGYSAAIDAQGNILAATRLGEPALVIADVAALRPAPTLMVRWGPWVGKAACGVLLLLALRPVMLRWRHGRGAGAAPPLAFPVKVAVLPPAARIAAGVLRVMARGGLLGMALLLALDDALRSNTLAQLRMFAGLFLAPEAASWCLLLAFRAKASIEGGQLVLAQGAQRLAIALAQVRETALWGLPVPAAGLSLRLASGQRWQLALDRPLDFAAALAAGGAPAAQAPAAVPAAAYARARMAPARWRLDHPVLKFLLLPLALALPAFHLHQHIAYGSALGEYYSYGLPAYLGAFGLWWAAWIIGVALCAALLRAAIEGASLLAAVLRPAQAADARLGLEGAGRLALYVGLPAWLAFKLLAP